MSSQYNVPRLKRVKIAPETINVVLIGYSFDSSINRFLVINSTISNISNNRLTDSRDAYFFKKKKNPLKSRLSTPKPNFSSSSDQVCFLLSLINLGF